MQAKATFTNYRNGTITHSIEECNITPDTGSQERDVINLYPKLANQQIDGFGGAITESVGYTLSLMPPSAQQQILDAVFRAEGLRYTLVRTSIDSCDFALSQYEASPSPDAPFDLRHDETYVIPYIQAAQKVCPETIGVMLTPWSPPAYMKSNGERSHGGALKPECYSAWAEYICRYIRSYQAHGLTVTRLSVQNEPNATQLWDSCLFTGEEEKTFLRDFLYPALIKAGLGDIAIYIWDHNKERLFDRVCEVVDESTARLIHGAAFHWYSGDHFDALRLVRAQYPALSLLFSEGCIEYNRFDREDQLQSARMYAHDMIGNFNAGMNTFLDWNIALGSDGGPNHAQNFCDAPILCNTKTGAFEKRLSYYYIWHFSHFIASGARHISTTTFSTEVDAAAFRNPDGTIVAVLSNNCAVERRVFLRLEGSLIEISLHADSIVSVEIAQD
ncbi:MAG: glycoside hydrolase family 30 beta sandwich domain-containing protein [Christensenella sp.]|nr:glycoside hydrolase family 30 beta sandwich domain-containing protein [Christensenella sp.]